VSSFEVKEARWIGMDDQTHKAGLGLVFIFENSLKMDFREALRGLHLFII